MSEQPNVIVVTGATGALGASVLKRCRADGSRVVTVTRSEGGATRLERPSGQHVQLHVDVTRSESLLQGLAQAAEELGAITGAVLAAGTWRGGRKFHEDVAAEDFRAALDANLESASSMLRAVLPGMVTRGRGSVVLVGSRSGVRPFTAAGDAAYATSKAALTALAQAVAAEVLDAGVRVNVVMPSTLDTPANRKAMPNAESSRWVALDSLSGVISFLLSDASRDISGAALPVYGRVGV
jgi:NAD(P)-dependent dehydrogenase (short-subunit alcohol dehydrogenase family)